jgi:hypothetical protein
MARKDGKRALSRYQAMHVDPDGVHVIGGTMLHSGADVRALMLLKMSGQEKPAQASLDIPIAEYNKLQILET